MTGERIFTGTYYIFSQSRLDNFSYQMRYVPTGEIIGSDSLYMLLPESEVRPFNNIKKMYIYKSHERNR